MTRHWNLFCLLGLLACSAGNGPGPADPKDTDATQDSDDPTDTDTQSDDEAPPFCVQSCTSNTDCDLGTEAYDADNYDCKEGACVYTGCNSDEECSTSWADNVCAEMDSGPSYCATACETQADCDLGSAPYDADNYDCKQGACHYTGCNSDSECASMLDSYVCLEHPFGIAYCVPGCDSNADCDLGSRAYDADNYQCTSGGCMYSGCNSDEECQSLGSEYICH